MKKKILAVCDSETEYTNRMQEFLCMREELPFEVYAFTDTEKLESTSKKEDIEILLISESDYSEKIKELPIENIYMLNESGHAEYENVEQVFLSGLINSENRNCNWCNCGHNRIKNVCIIFSHYNHVLPKKYTFLHHSK